MSEPKLLPCPFCSGEPTIHRQGNDFTRTRKVTIKCKGCRVQITNGAIRNSMAWVEQITVADWNRRACDAEYVLDLLVIAGHVSAEKVSQAREIAARAKPEHGEG